MPVISNPGVMAPAVCGKRVSAGGLLKGPAAPTGPAEERQTRGRVGLQGRRGAAPQTHLRHPWPRCGAVGPLWCPPRT